MVEDEPAPSVTKPAPKPTAKPKVVVELDEDDEEEKPKKKTVKAVVEDDDEDEKPKKKRKVTEDDDEDEEPKKKKKKKQAAESEGGTSMVRNIVGGVVLVILLCVVAFVFVFYDKFGKKDDDTAAAPKSDPPAVTQGPGPQGPGPQGPGPKLPVTPGPGPKDSGGPSKGVPKYGRINSVAMSADGEKLATLGSIAGGTGKASLQVWDLYNSPVPQKARECKATQISYNGPIALSPDGKLVATLDGASADTCTITFCDVATGNMIREATGPFTGSLPSSIGFTADGSAVVAVTGNAFVTVGTTGPVTVKKPAEIILTGQEVYVPGLNRVADVRENSNASATELLLWDPATEDPPKKIVLEGVKTRPSAFAVSPNGTTVAVCSQVRDFEGKDQGHLTLHEASSGKLIVQLPDDEDPKCRRYAKLTFSSGGKFLAGIGAGYGAQFNSVVLFRVADATRITRKTGDPKADEREFADAPVFSRENTMLAYLDCRRFCVNG